MFFRRPPEPSEPNNGFPDDAVIIVVPRVLIDRLLLLVIVLALGGTVSVQIWNISGSNHVSESGFKR